MAVKFDKPERPGMPLNAFLDLLQMAMPELEKIGDRNPKIEIHSPYELFMWLTAAVAELPADVQSVGLMHLNDLEKIFKGG